MKTKLLLLIPVLVSFMACKKIAGTDVGGGGTTTTTTADGYSSDHIHNLNLIYFVPNDLDTLPGYQKRLSDLMLWGQKFYKDEMTRNGYPDKTFGMFVNSANRVKIIVIRGTKPKSSYPYSGGSGAVSQEINAYFAAHPADNTSEHTLVIMPRYEFKPDGTPSGGPFYGTGKWCYALDYEGLDIKNLGKTDADGKRFSVWFGGMMHELGHGLNLPHNCQKVSENETLGMALMWAGNGTLGISKTFLTATDCAILNVNQIFNKDNKTYYGPVKASITKIHADYVAAKSAIVVSGKFNSDTKVNSVVYYNDPNVNNEGTGVNHDYNAVTWESKAIGVDSFYVEMPISEFKYKDGSPYELKVKLVHDNGNVTETIYNYEFVNGIPVLKFSSRDEFSKQGWNVINVSSQETAAENGNAANLIDGMGNTYWHSQYSGTVAVYPHSFTVDMGTAKLVSGFSISQRSGLQRAVKDFEIQYSTDGQNFVSAGSLVLANANGAQYFSLPSKQSLRYIKLIAKSSYDGQSFAALAEVGAY
ncbi:discoidin domain-containing protein [Pedobacter cryoconitis]|uniref:F5/8 type C domain-containing protein n=1 Tax=Pedobacter cryoconitis TaxID=188932 RepID=A0A7X0MKD3_9SPHI|nr:discoidin domain-containing protein [Pedobacter cryoconitis]MBB6502069.1 hypothetical protein [Pedobacter cryoconitis]